MSRFFWTQKQDMGPWPRGGHALAYDSGRGRVVLFGGAAIVPAPTPEMPNGFTETTFNDTWEWDGSLWSQMANFGPPARSDHVLAYDARPPAATFVRWSKQPTSSGGYLGMERRRLDTAVR